MGRVAPAKTKLLRSVPIFASCSDRELAAVSQLVDEVAVTEGDVLIREGRLGHETFFIVSGEAGVTRGGEFLARLWAGDFFGEMAVLDQKGRSATVTALTPMQLLVVHARDLSSVLDQGAVTGAVLRTLATRLRQADESLTIA